MRFGYYLLALLAGTFLTLQVGINGRLRAGLGNPLLASLISFTVGTLGLAVTFAATLLLGARDALPVPTVRNTQWKIGFANLFSLVVAGQILLALVFDGFGLLGNPVHVLSPLRAVGAVLLIAGVYLIQSF